jgi:hypothetical protein
VLSTRQNFAHCLAIGAILRGGRAVLRATRDQGIAWIEEGIKDYRAIGTILGVPSFLAIKAQALHLANRTSEALAAIKEADALVAKYEQQNVRAELHRFRGVFLAAIGGDETLIEDSLCAAIRTAREQKSVSLEKRAEASYAEYRRQKASGPGERGFRLALW